MKKRNKPILLATLLVVFVSAAVAMNIALQPKTEEQLAREQQERAAALAKEEDAKDLGAKRTAENNSEAAKATAAAFSTKKKPHMGPTPSSEGPGMPTALKKKHLDIPKPKPNATLTSGQWYAKEFGVKDPSK